MSNLIIRRIIEKWHSYKKFFMLLMVGILILVIGCSLQDKQVLEPGILAGKISIGPLCPVETIPPDPNCQPTEAT
jgi:fructose-specific phosphotransferase system IIC component